MSDAIDKIQRPICPECGKEMNSFSSPFSYFFDCIPCKAKKRPPWPTFDFQNFQNFQDSKKERK